MDEALGRRLDAIEKRLAALEARANGIFLTPAAPVPAAPTGVPSNPPPPPLPPPLPRANVPQAQAVNSQYAEQMRAAFAHVPADLAGAREPVGPAPARLVGGHGTAAKSFNLEQLLGLKLAGWIGAVVLLIGAALGVKFAYDQGWLGGLPGGVRCAMIAAAGLGLIGLGELVFRRVNKLASAGPFGAGVGLLFLAAYAGQAWHALYSPGAAFGLMALVALVGMAIAARADLVSIAAIAIIGGGLFAPASVKVGEPGLSFLAYILSLQILALGLCAWRATPKWWILRGLSLFVSSAWLIDLLADKPLEDWTTVAFAAVTVVLFHAELIWTTRRHVRGGWAEPTRGVTFSLLATLAFAAELMIAFRDMPGITRGNTLISLVPLAFVLARLCGRLNLRALSRGFDVQAVMLLLIAIPIRLEGPGVLFSWIGVAAALAVLAIVQKTRFATWLAIGTWAVAGLATLIWVNTFEESRVAWLHVDLFAGPGGRQAISAGVVAALAVALCGHLIAVAIRRVYAWGGYGLPTQDTGAVADFFGALLFFIVLIPNVAGPYVTLAGVAYAVAMWAAAIVQPKSSLAALAVAMLGVTALHWAAAVIGLHLGHADSARAWIERTRFILNDETQNGLLIAAAMTLFALTRPLRSAQSIGVLSVALLGVAVLIASEEVSRYAVRQTGGPEWIVRQVGWSIAWSVLAVAALVIGFLGHHRPLRLVALGLLGVTLLKVVLIDMAGAGTGWRILSFLALGALLLITSVLYGRFAKKNTEASTA